MAQQRIHNATLARLKETKAKVNEANKELGVKPLTIPDLIDLMSIEYFERLVKGDNNG